jgi:hypothetical protein
MSASSSSAPGLRSRYCGANERLRARGLLEQRRGRWRASPLGFNFLNDLVSEFLGATAKPRQNSGRGKSGRRSGPDLFTAAPRTDTN